MEARSTKQVHGSKKQKPSSETINLAVEKKFPGSSTNTCRSKKNMPTGSRKHTSKSPTFFVTLGPKKNLVRSKKHVQVQKKGAQVQKTCIPITLGTCQPIRLNLNSAWTKSIKKHALWLVNKCGLERAYTPERQMFQSIIFVHQLRVYPHFRMLTDTNSHTFRWTDVMQKYTRTVNH